MTAITISRNAQAALEVAQWVRNGRAPVAELQNKLATMCGFWANVREKLIWRSRGGLVTTGGGSAVPSSLATRSRWRFAFHTGPFASFIYARFEIAPQDNGAATDPYCTLAIRSTSGTLIGTAFMHGGSSPGTYADVPINMTGGRAHLIDGTGAFVFLNEDTEYTGVFSDIGFARLQSASVWEVALAPSTENGYVPNTTGTGAPILDEDRDDVTAMARLLHKRSGLPVFHWCSDLDSDAPVSSAGDAEGALAATLAPLTLSATGTVGGGTGAAALALAPLTMSATGTTAQFTVTPSFHGNTNEVAHGRNELVFWVDIHAVVQQTNGQFAIRVGFPFPDDQADRGPITSYIGQIDTVDSAYWDQISPWSVVDNLYYIAHFQAATVAETIGGDTEMEFLLISGDHDYGGGAGELYITTNSGTVAGVGGTGYAVATDQVFAPDSSPLLFGVD